MELKAQKLLDIFCLIFQVSFLIRTLTRLCLVATFVLRKPTSTTAHTVTRKYVTTAKQHTVTFSKGRSPGTNPVIF